MVPNNEDSSWWNCQELTPPVLTSFPYAVQEQAERIPAITNIYKAFKHLEKLPALHASLDVEMFVMKRAIYKGSNQFRAEKRMGDMRKLLRTLANYLGLDIFGYAEKAASLSQGRLEFLTLGCLSEKPVYIMAQQVAQYLLARVLGGCMLLARCRRLCEELYKHCRQTLALGHFYMNMSVMAANISRLWYLSRDLYLRLSSVYKLLMAAMPQLKSAPSPWLPENCHLPADVDLSTSVSNMMETDLNASDQLIDYKSEENMECENVVNNEADNSGTLEINGGDHRKLERTKEESVESFYGESTQRRNSNISASVMEDLGSVIVRENSNECDGKSIKMKQKEKKQTFDESPNKVVEKHENLAQYKQLQLLISLKEKQYEASESGKEKKKLMKVIKNLRKKRKLTKMKIKGLNAGKNVKVSVKEEKVVKKIDSCTNVTKNLPSNKPLKPSFDESTNVIEKKGEIQSEFNRLKGLIALKKKQYKESDSEKEKQNLTKLIKKLRKKQRMVEIEVNALTEEKTVAKLENVEISSNAAHLTSSKPSKHKKKVKNVTIVSDVKNIEHSNKQVSDVAKDTVKQKSVTSLAKIGIVKPKKQRDSSIEAELTKTIKGGDVMVKKGKNKRVERKKKSNKKQSKS